MNIENQVCTLEQAKRLKELGVCQDSYFLFGEEAGRIVEGWSVEGYEDNFYSAFTVAELGVMLPKRLQASWKRKDDTGLGGSWESSCNCPLEMQYDEKKKLHIVKYVLAFSGKGTTEAIARASLLIGILEYKLISVEEVNQRLQAA